MESSTKSARSGAWFIFPTVLLLVALVLGGLGISSLVGVVRSDLRAYQPNSSVQVAGEGLTLYAESGTPRLGDLRCAVTGQDGQRRLAPDGGGILRNDLGTFVSIASTPRSLPAGRYVISCDGASGGSDVALYLGARLDVAAVGRLAIFGIVAPLFLGFCSVVLFAVLAFLRYRSRRSPPAAAGT